MQSTGMVQMHGLMLIPIIKERKGPRRKGVSVTDLRVMKF